METVSLSSLDGRKYFTSGMPDVTIPSTDGTPLQVTVACDGTQVFSENLWPVGGVITLSELGMLLEPYARKQLVSSVTISAGTAVSTFSVLYAMADVGIGAEEFYNGYFLSILMGTKMTALGRLEYLHYFGTDSASCTALYSDNTTATFTPQIIGGNSRYTTLDVSPDRFQSADKQLVSYTVRAGTRAQRFDLDPTVPDCAPILLFDNSFGVQELLYCTGTHKVAPEYKRSSARINGLLRNYEIEEARVFHADTGIMNTAMANWADELFRSREVYVVNIYGGNPTVGKEVVITDSKSEYTNDDDDMPRFTFTYQYAQRLHNVLQIGRAGRIFDNTFDYTFN